ncbi:MAG: carboxypeptidase-like regulatory domain-containing protein [Cytophagales bacterium]|nr:TonB-dependent receptor [Bernardetiaceae bacterium]MDW8204890.1 carboxypeptidase-like regulatory domain-containing protein [Cytophagales bacterium]
MRLITIILLVCLLVQTVVFHVHAQEKYTLSGYVRDSKSGETLIGVNIAVKGTAIGTTTNPYGFYSLTLPKGTYQIVYSFIGYQQVVKTIDLSTNQRQDIELSEENIELQEVVVTAEAADAAVKSMEMSVNRLDIKTIQRIPAFLGEVDVIRSIQLLPGVSTVGEGATGFNVRGGSIDQNLVLIDEAPVYNSAHLFGFFSVFNPDAVKDVKLIKGGIPSPYGGRLSSILDVRTKEGNNRRFAMQGGIGAIFSRLTLEAPIVKDKASFIVAGRRSYIDILAKPFLNNDLRNSRFYFYDLTAKVNWKANDRNNFYLSSYFGRDVFGSGFDFNWGNATTTFRWNHLYSDRLFMNLTAFYSNYDYLLGFRDSGVQGSRFDWRSNIINYSIKPDLTYYLNANNTLKFGLQSILYDFRPGKAIITSADRTSDISLDSKYALESALYIDNEQKLSERVSVQYGLRYSMFNYMGRGEAFTFGEAPPNTRRVPIETRTYGQFETIQRYANFEPRFAINWGLSPTSSLKASYNRMAQYIHLVSNTAASTPLDIWTPSTNNIRPQLADQIAIGYFRNLKDNMWETSVEVYYKTMQNQLDYIDNADLLLNRFIEGDLVQGIGRAYGAEFYIRKTRGQLTGWISYTLANSERKVEGINSNQWFPNRFDRRHNGNISVSYEYNKDWQFSANFVFQTGTPVTFPTGRYEVQGLIIPHNVDNSRNNVRIAPYHRLDLSVTKYNKKKKPEQRWESYWVFSVYNAYNRRNPFAIYFRQNPDVPVNTEAIRFSVVGSFVPAISYNFKY